MLKYTKTKAGLKIHWENEDRSRTATFLISAESPEREQIQELAKATGFLLTQAGLVPATPAPAPVTASGAEPVTARTAATGNSPLLTAEAAPTGGRIQMMPPESLSEMPAGGARPSNAAFWESMPTVNVPSALASDTAGGWEMIPPGEA